MLIVKKHRKLVLNLKEPERVTSIMPKARTIEYKGKTLVAVPHNLDEVRVLRNIGIDAPSPIDSYYDWPGRHKPYKHQTITASFLTLNPRAYCLNGMGSGKTRAVLYAFDYLRKQGAAKRMLILAPLSTLERAWGDEIFKNFSDMTFTVLHGSRERRHALLAMDFDVYIINHDGIRNDETLQLLIDREELDLFVVDELASFRNAQTDRWKYLNRLVNGDKKRGEKPKDWVWGLTGAPTPNAPTDAFAQVKLIQPHRAIGHFGRFRDVVMNKHGPFKWVPKPSSADVIKDMMQPAVRFRREDCIDLPPTTYLTHHCPLSPEQKKAFDQMVAKLKADFDGEQITAVNEANKVSKLMQICCGTAIGTEGEVWIGAKPRIDLVLELIEQSESKTIVFVPFTNALRYVVAEIEKHHTVAWVNGEVSRTKRDKIFDAFQNAKQPQVLIADPRTMSHGLTLTSASTTIWYGTPPGNDTYLQANERTPRPGQKLSTLIVNIESTPVEVRRYEQLRGQTTTQSLLLDLIKGTL
jgi:SNF2 family DNA or RNA helicase